MAKAVSKHTPSLPPIAEEQWTVDDAFQYLTRVVCFPNNLAIRELKGTLLDGRLPMTCRHFVNVGDKPVLTGSGIVRHDFWGDHLTLRLIDGHAQRSEERRVGKEGRSRWSRDD